MRRALPLACVVGLLFGACDSDSGDDDDGTIATGTTSGTTSGTSSGTSAGAATGTGSGSGSATGGQGGSTGGGGSGGNASTGGNSSGGGSAYGCTPGALAVSCDTSANSWACIDYHQGYDATTQQNHCLGLTPPGIPSTSPCDTSGAIGSCAQGVTPAHCAVTWSFPPVTVAIAQASCAGDFTAL